MLPTWKAFRVYVRYVGKGEIGLSQRESIWNFEKIPIEQTNTSFWMQIIFKHIDEYFDNLLGVEIHSVSSNGSIPMWFLTAVMRRVSKDIGLSRYKYTLFLTVAWFLPLSWAESIANLRFILLPPNKAR